MTQVLPRQEGRHILVTGAGTGIGKAVALRLAAEGARLSLLARNTDRLHATAEAIERAGGVRPSVAGADIRAQSEVDAAVDSLTQDGLLHGIVANAGIGGENTPGPGDRFTDLVQTNLVGTYHCLRAAERRLAPGPQARQMVVVSSILGRFGVPGYTGYCASKTALLGLTRALALELSPKRVLVNAVCPGWVNTEMAREGIQGMADAMGVDFDTAHAEAMKAVPLGKMSEPAEVAGLIAWLMSAESAGVTGQALDMNNGAWM